ncbi:MAG: translesion error-prone DNA polymerase V autoproteolytic subunit [Rhodocyclaceae bacterium]|jgi:DNA polymerase V
MIFVPAPEPMRVARPLFRSRVPAGLPAAAEDHIDGCLDLNEHLVEHRESTYFIRVQGQSMSGAGIQDGDLLVVDRALEARDGDIVVALVDHELTLKRLFKRNGQVRLLPENPCFRPIELADGQELSVWGVATSVVHRLK